MSSRGQALKPVIQDEKEEDFYDCRETPDLREDEETQQEAPAFHTKTGTVLRLHQEEEKEKQGNRPEEEEKEKQGNRPEEEEKEKQGDRPEEEEEKQGDSPEEEEEKQGDRPEEEEEKQGDRPEEEEENSDSDLKHDNSKGVEFDDDYLRELEKDLTQEEKASRRQQSLTMKEKGNDLFKAGDWLEAECCYTDALGLCPVCFSRERAVLFSNRAAARHHLDLKDQAISDCTRAIELDSEYLRALLRRAELYEQTDKLDEALEDYKQVLERDPNQASARQACMRLPQQIQERNEKLKEEMISKLKDLGNMFLRPFGLSTNNFQVNQDQETGSYSINFVQNPNNNR